MPAVSIQYKSKLPAIFAERGWTLKNSLPGLMRQQGRLTAVSLAFQAQPFGIDDKAQALGQVATNRDIYKVYATPGKAYADISDPKKQAAFWSCMKKGLWDRAQKIISTAGKALKFSPILPFDGGTAHQSLRNNRGRITGAQKPVMIVQDPKRVEAYVKKEVAKVGTGKSGWASCARALGGVAGIPGWITRHNAPATVVENYGDGTEVEIVLTNQVPYASEILTGPQKSEAIDIANDKLLKSIRIAESFAVRKADR